MEIGEISLCEHPRATASIRRAKGAAGLGAFLLVFALAMRAGLPSADAGIRGLLFGVGAYFMAWGVAVTVWRQLLLGELEVARERRRARIASLVGDDDA